MAIATHAEALEALAGGGDLDAAEAAEAADHAADHTADHTTRPLGPSTRSGGPGTVAAYVSVGSEPGTLPLVGRLYARGIRVLLPVLLPDNDLSWGLYTGDEHLVTVHHEGRMALREPAAPHLSPDAVLQADVVLLPGLAVDRTGMRLGRGGGSYDRVLSRLEQAGRDPYLVVLLYDEEVTATLPHEPHDRPVHAAVTPSGVHRFP